MSTQANSATLISGNSGSGKTSLLATLAEWLWRNHKKILRLYTCDGGGYGTKVQALIQAGLVQPWRMRTRARGGGEGLIEETCMRVSQGWWPVEIDQLTGDSPEGVELVAPMTAAYTLKCQSGHEVRVTPNKSVFSSPNQCPTCKAVVTLQNGHLEVSHALNPGFDEVGAVAFEGLTSMSDWIMMSLADRTGRSELGGEKSALGGNIKSGAMLFGSNNRAHYGFAQLQAEKWLLNSTAIPRLKVPPIWTSLEARNDDSSGTVLPFYGPAIAGQAKTGKVPQWVGNYLGCQVVLDDKGKKEWRLYLSEYRDPDGIAHIYKTRAAEAGLVPEFLTDDPARAFGKFNLGVFFDMMESITANSLKAAMEEFPDAPGIRQTPLPKPVAPPQQGGGMPAVGAPPGPSPAPGPAPGPARVGALPGIPNVGGKPLPKPAAPAKPPVVGGR